MTSIRYWYPDIEIVLIKDILKGSFNTCFLENLFNVQVFNSNEKYGWGYGKLEPLFISREESFLVLDSDTILTGPILDLVQDIDEYFVVDEEIQNTERFNEIYYDKSLINQVNYGFRPLEYSFNTGQWFGTSGIIDRSVFNETIHWASPRINKFPDIIKNGEQGHLNYHFHKLEQQNKITIKRLKIMYFPLSFNVHFKWNSLRLKQNNKNFIVHWAGIKKPILLMPNKMLLFFYLNQYRKKTNIWIAFKLLIKLMHS